jgi:predicted RND superfamily exporter protein
LLGGILALTSETIDTDILGVAIISFGLAVDDTIHFLHRYDIERRRSGTIRDALAQTFGYTGSAIIRTTVILGCGLVPFAFSSYLSIRFLGTYLVFVLVCAILADLLLLPALVLLFDKEESP